MSPDPAGPDPVVEDERSLLAFASLLLRRRRLIIALGAIGGIIGLLSGLLSRRVYVSGVTFLPQTTELNLGGLALAASQLGVKVPTSPGGGWSPAVYVELLNSRELLQSLAQDTIAVAEEGGKRMALVDLLKVDRDRPLERPERGAIALREVIKPREIKALNAVEVTVTTRWPSVSQAIAQRLVNEVHRFNLETRQSQASAERKFVEAQAEEAGRLLREAEDRLQLFLQRNRVLSAPELEFQRDRLQREVTLKQQVYTGLMQSQEEARVREVRDTPVITLLESARVPVLPAPRRSVLKAALGALAGGLLGLAIAIVSQGLSGARAAGGGEAAEFFQLIDETIPQFRRRRVS